MEYSTVAWKFAYFDHITLFEVNLASFPGSSVWEQDPGNEAKVNFVLACTLYVSKN